MASADLEALVKCHLDRAVEALRAARSGRRSSKNLSAPTTSPSEGCGASTVGTRRAATSLRAGHRDRPFDSAMGYHHRNHSIPSVGPPSGR
jgi:hypothetical protein